MVADRSTASLGPRRRPWLIYGAGRFSQTVATAVKARLLARHGAVPEHVQLRVWDTAPAIAPVEADGRRVALEPEREFLRLNAVPLEDLQRHLAHHPALGRYFALLPSNARLGSLEDGAGQNRVATAIAFAYAFEPLIRPALRAALLALTDATRPDWLRSPGLLGLGSGWGGNSSGLLLPATAALRHVAADEGISLDDALFWGIVALPGGSTQRTLQSDINACGLLRELRHFQEHGGLAVPLPGGVVARCDHAPFDYLLLESVQGQDNSHLTSAEQLIDMLVEAALLLVDSPLGDAQRGFARDHRLALRRRGVRGDLAAFSNLSVVAAELRRAPLLHFLGQQAVAQLAAHLLGAPRKASDPTAALDEVRPPRALHALTHTPSGRAFLSDFAAEATATLVAQPPRGRDLGPRCRELADQFAKRRLPAAAERTAERARALWRTAETLLNAEVHRLLALGQAPAAAALLAAALAQLDAMTLGTGAEGEDAATRAAARLAEAQRGFPLRPGRGAEVRRAQDALLQAHATQIQQALEATASAQWEAERLQTQARLAARHAAIVRLLQALAATAQTAQAAATTALAEAVRGPEAEAGAAPLLRDRLLEASDAWRAYGELFASSDAEGLTDAAAEALRARLGELERLLGADEPAVAAALEGAVAPALAPWRERGIEAALDWLGEGVASAVLARLKVLAVERWSYSPALLEDGVRPHPVFALGVPDRERSRFAADASLEVISTGDPERLVLVRLALGVPASALTIWPRLEQAAARRGDHPLHNLPDFPPTGSPVEVTGRKSRRRTVPREEGAAPLAAPPASVYDPAATRNGA